MFVSFYPSATLEFLAWPARPPGPVVAFVAVVPKAFPLRSYRVELLFIFLSPSSIVYPFIALDVLIAIPGILIAPTPILTT